MIRIVIIVVAAAFALLAAREPDPRLRAALDALTPHVHEIEGADGGFYCPMDPDIRASKSGTCPRCGMNLVRGYPDLVEYPLDLQMTPPAPRPNEPTRLTFGLTDPRTSERARRFEVVHEKLYHVFVVSDDLSFFLHTHPERSADEDFHLDVKFPKPGMYRVLSDFYPSGGGPQLIVNTLFVPGVQSTSSLERVRRDLDPKQTENAHVELKIETSAVAGARTLLRFKLSPAEGLEPYLGAWGHVLAASGDLVDMIHAHPLSATDDKSGKDLAFNMAFPRSGIYRVWLQFQRQGVVNTAAFNIPVTENGHWRDFAVAAK
jgi:hypothetical protein